jgi:NitT/TauT family transport system substrate-binding protein
MMPTLLRIWLFGALGALVIATPVAHAADKLRVGVAAVYPPYAIPQAAQELGIYKEAGLDVEVTLYRGSSPAQEALASDLADVITLPPHAAALAIAKGVKERIIAFTGDLDLAGWYITVRKDSAIKTAADLEGKTIAIGGKGSSTDFLTLLALMRTKVTAQTIPLGNPGVMPALKSGQVDAGIAWPLVSYQELVSGNFRPVFDFSKIDDKMVLNTWGASDKIIADHPDWLRRWLKANQAAIVYMQTHADWSLKFLKRYTGEEDDRVVKSAYDDSVMHLIADQKVKPQWLQASLDLAAQSGIKDMSPVDRIYAKEFVDSN